jgi:hypothetical protein
MTYHCHHFSDNPVFSRDRGLLRIPRSAILRLCFEGLFGVW